MSFVVTTHHFSFYCSRLQRHQADIRYAVLTWRTVGRDADGQATSFAFCCRAHGCALPTGAGDVLYATPATAEPQDVSEGVEAVVSLDVGLAPVLAPAARALPPPLCSVHPPPREADRSLENLRLCPEGAFTAVGKRIRRLLPIRAVCEHGGEQQTAQPVHKRASEGRHLH